MTASVVIGLIVAVLAAGFAHHEIPAFTQGFVKKEIAHLVLIVVGCAFGVVCAWLPALPMPRWAAFAIGFGVVHLPASAILLLKRWRHAGQS
ncbi:hypothetical protein [Paraburkholderia solisilvae]|uniref:Uncharacterized protein n=1 Tax=Paraburkholderia solisilvae TaxID=624376 RepID=A0A6J5DN76_9BURK|nr:hypothetical protein [Paraburkholderia solisilvae]CAB3755679.1 hypothetical protein LMG29739_02244 [Paraburkholderia solisilvae]